MLEPVSSQARSRPKAGPTSGFASGVNVIGPVDDGLDAGLRERRHPLHGHRDDGLDPVQLRRQQLHAELGRYAVHAPRAAVRLVGSDDEAVAFLAQIPNSPPGRG